MAALTINLCLANVYDVIMPEYVAPCECAPWSKVSSNATEQARINSYWADGKPPSNARNFCAMPASSAGKFECDGCKVDETYNSFKGPWCYCKGKHEGGKHRRRRKNKPIKPIYNGTYCEPPEGVPEQAR